MGNCKYVNNELSEKEASTCWKVSNDIISGELNISLCTTHGKMKLDIPLYLYSFKEVKLSLTQTASIIEMTPSSADPFSCKSKSVSEVFD